VINLINWFQLATVPAMTWLPTAPLPASFSLHVPLLLRWV
jgi:hypothetical protein